MVVPPSSVSPAGRLHRQHQRRHAEERAVGADRDCVRNVHCAQALAAATIIVSFAPSRSSAAKSTAHDTDIVEPLVASGRLTFSADASDEHPSSTGEQDESWRSNGAQKTAKTSAPAARRPRRRAVPITGGPSHHSGWGSQTTRGILEAPADLALTGSRLPGSAGRRRVSGSS